MDLDISGLDLSALRASTQYAIAHWQSLAGGSALFAFGASTSVVGIVDETRRSAISRSHFDNPSGAQTFIWTFVGAAIALAGIDLAINGGANVQAFLNAFSRRC